MLLAQLPEALSGYPPKFYQNNESKEFNHISNHKTLTASNVVLNLPDE